MIALLIVLILLVSGIVLVKNASGVSPPFTVIESNSMQHSDDKSQIGVIDTGDMIMVKSLGKSNVVTYVEGHQSGHQEFGDYGSVIIYKRAVGNPVIHRAILWIEYDSDGIWIPKGRIKRNRMGMIVLPVVPRRCDHLRAKITGRGGFRILSLSKVLEVGSDG